MKIITHELLKSWSPCEDGYRRFCQLFPNGADLKTAIDGLVADDHDDWGFWLFNAARDSGGFVDECANGYRNTGNWNTGNWNTGNRNTGDRNTGNRNTGDWNAGYGNAGDRNTGNSNTGDWNTGYGNAGDRNTGNSNTGDWNTGNWNTGNWNTGDRNTGDRNTGNWNAGSWNAGFFNSATPEYILAFNAPISREIWERAKKPSFIYFDLTYWVGESNMTEDDKKADPNFYIRGGQLRAKKYKDAWREAWNGASIEDRRLLLALPNFDADVFLEISGIDVRLEMENCNG